MLIESSAALRLLPQLLAGRTAEETNMSDQQKPDRNKNEPHEKPGSQNQPKGGENPGGHKPNQGHQPGHDSGRQGGGQHNR